MQGILATETEGVEEQSVLSTSINHEDDMEIFDGDSDFRKPSAEMSDQRILKVLR